MRAITTDLPGLLILEPVVYGDARGYFYESYNARVFEQVTGQNPVFVQDNCSLSTRGVLRGLHYQIQHTQGKMIRVSAGEILDGVLAIRRRSPTFGRWFSVRLSEDNHRHLWIPPGFAHGFVTISESAQVHYKTTDYWMRDHERCILWNDPAIGINWEYEGDKIISDKDRQGSLLADAEVFA